MTKTLRTCAHCGVPLPEGTASFRVSGDSAGGITGLFCCVKHYLAERYGPEEVEAAYARAFVPIARRHGDADTLQPIKEMP